MCVYVWAISNFFIIYAYFLSRIAKGVVALEENNVLYHIFNYFLPKLYSTLISICILNHLWYYTNSIQHESDTCTMHCSDTLVTNFFTHTLDNK